jgi:preprotein translocase subunit SecE
MVLKAENQDGIRSDWLKWLIAAVLLLAGLVANYYYSHVSMLLRTAVWVLLLAASLFVASKTKKGRWVVDFVWDAKLELRKVVWPTRDETMQTTLVVAVMVVILALLLWGMDSILVWLIGWLTGQAS